MGAMTTARNLGFEEETRHFLQERLRKILGWLGIILVVAAVAMLTARTQSGMPFLDGIVDFCTNPSTLAILPLALLASTGKSARTCCTSRMGRAVTSGVETWRTGTPVFP